MKYDSKIHQRRTIRLKEFDYSKAGLYFISLCCDHKTSRFGKIEDGERFTSAQMILNEFGKIAHNEWEKLPERFSNFELDVFQIMPNHMHGIILLHDNSEAAGPAHTNATVGDIMGAYKSLVANGCLEIYKSNNKIMGKLWQRNYHEHIIRNEQSYQTISDYIINNPAKSLL